MDTPMITPQQQFDEGMPIRRKDAIEQGLPLFLGNRCSRGHSGWRYTAGRACYECGDDPPTLDARKAITLYVLDGIWYEYPAGTLVVQPPRHLTRTEAASLGFEIYWSRLEGWQLV